MKRRGVIAALCAFFFTLAILVAGVSAFVYMKIQPFSNYALIMPNVYCAGVDLGGLTKEEALRNLEDALSKPSFSVDLVLDDATYTFTPKQEGSLNNAEEIVQQAYNYKRSDTSAYGLFRAYQEALKTECYLSAEANFLYSKDDIKALAKQIEEETFVASTPSSGTFDSDTHTASITLGTPGKCISAGAITEAVCEAFDSMNFDDIHLEYDTVALDLENIKTTCKEVVSGASLDPTPATVYVDQEAHTIDVTGGLPGYSTNYENLYNLAIGAIERGTYGSLSITLEEIQPDIPDISDAVEEVSCDVREPYYEDGDVHEGQNGYSVDMAMARSMISNLKNGEMISIPTEVSYPEKTADEIRAVLFRDRLSSYSTAHTAIANRTTNLNLCCQAIDGTVINPGEIFSFNDIVGERTAEKGYKEATVYVGTESKGELGGGICQVASTIHMAVLYANLEIIDRQPHIYLVTYVPGGLDATVYWGTQDYCFRNNTEYPIRINAYVSGGYVYVSLDGTDVNNYTVKLESKCLSSTPYTTRTEYTTEKPYGYSEVISPYTGYEYEAYQYIYDSNGNLIETNYLGISEYEKRDRIYLYGRG